MLLIIVTCLLVLLLLKYHWDRRMFYRASWTMNGPPALPFIGNALLFMNSSKIVEKVHQLGLVYGSPFRFWLANRFLIIFNDPESIEVILNSPETMDKGDVYQFVTKVMGGDGLFTSAGNEWKRHRKLLNPTIQHFNVLNSFYPIFNTHLSELMDKLNERIGAGEFNIYNLLEECSLKMICETTFGTKMNLKDNRNTDFLDSSNVMMHVAGKLILQPWLQVPAIFRLSKYHKLLETSTSNARSFASKIIQNKIKEYQSSSKKKLDVNGNNTNDMLPKRHANNFIDECLKLSIQEKHFTEEELINESLTMLIGGFETTATTVSYIVLMLAMYPDYQQQAFEEIKQIFPHQYSDVLAEDIGKLQFVNRFIKESMRVNPTVPFVARCAKNSVKIGKYNIPKHSELILTIFNMQRSEQVWGPTAGIFDPDHFLSETERHAYSFIPFSAGPRNCIGLKYGNIVVRMFVCWLVRNYRFTTTLTLKDLQYRMSVTLKLENGHMVSVHKRSKY